MNREKKTTVIALGAMLAFVACVAFAKSANEAKGRQTSKTAESSVTTNENGSVSRTFLESTVTTNGNMVTEHRRETRTNMDMEGNVLETSTSEYAQSYPVGDNGVRPLASISGRAEPSDATETKFDSFLGLKFGDTFAATNYVRDASEPDYLRAQFKPKKPLAGFDDFYVYVTPKTHKIAKIFACAKNPVEPGSRWRRHYLIEALEKRYNTWARLCSWFRPCYSFDVGPGRHVTACLDGASDSYPTIIAAWDDDVGFVAAEEREQMLEEARKTAAEKRNRRVSDAADAF